MPTIRAIVADIALAFIVGVALIVAWVMVWLANRKTRDEGQLSDQWQPDREQERERKMKARNE